MHSIRHHPASVGTQIRQFGRGATGHGSDQDAAHSGGYRTRRERLLVTVCNAGLRLTYPGRPESTPTQDPWRVLGLPWLHLR